MVKLKHVFHNAVTTTGDGVTLPIVCDHSPDAVVVIAITGTATASTVNFKGLDGNGKYTDLYCTNLTTGTGAIQTTGTDEIWRVNVAGLEGVRCNISAVSGGSLTITGKLII